MDTPRFGFAVAAVALGLIFAGSAFGAVTPKLTVSVGGPAVTIKISEQNPSDDAIGKLEIYVPNGFGLKAPVGGAVIGTVTGQALVKDVDPAAEHGYTGDVVAVGPTDPAIAYEHASCDNTTHAAAWLVRTRTDEGTTNIPIFVDKTPAAQTQLGGYKLVICMRPPDLAGGSANRSPMGTKIDSMRLVLSGFTIPKVTGEYRWRSLWTPFAAGTATMNAAGRVEAQSIVRVPTGVLTLAAKRMPTGNQFRLSGHLTAGTQPAHGIRVGLSHGQSKSRLVSVGSTTTTGAGSYVKLATVTRPQWFQAGATLLDQDLGPGACTPSFGAGIPCADTTMGASHILSNYVRVRK